jgi:hypothetical protein
MTVVPREAADSIASSPLSVEGRGCVKTSSAGEWTRGRRRWNRRRPPCSISASHDKLTYAFIAWISAVVPKIFIALFKLYANTCRLISVRTRGNVLVRKCVEPIHAFSVPNGCSTVCRRSRAACGVWSSRRCMSSNTFSCSHRLTLRYGLGVHRDFNAHFGQADGQ